MSIGGIVDYARLSQLHQPNDHARMAAEVRRLAIGGLTAADISVALKLDLVQVQEMLAAADAEAVTVVCRAGAR